MPSTICALATPPGEGGIAVVRVSGPESYPIVERVFRPVHAAKTVAAARGYTALLGHYLLRGVEMDQTVALFYRAPHSYTGEDVIELSVHGGSAMAGGLLEALYLAGSYRDKAPMDNDYAADGYARDMELEHIYMEAEKRLK